MRDAVIVRLQFLVQLDQALLHIFADLKTDDDQGASFAGGGINVFNAWDFPEQLFHGASRALFDFLGS